MIKVLVTGSEGQLGQSLKLVSKNYSKIEWNFMSKNQLDIQKFDQIISVVLNKKIQTINGVSRTETYISLDQQIDRQIAI